MSPAGPKRSSMLNDLVTCTNRLKLPHDDHSNITQSHSLARRCMRYVHIKMHYVAIISENFGKI